LPLRAIAVEWLVPMLRLLLFFGPVAALAFASARFIPHAVPKLALMLFVSLTIGGWLLLKTGLPREMKKELVLRAPRFFDPFLRRVFPDLF
jgi:hypothetical protein